MRMPFTYSKAKHRRRHNPPPATDYTVYKPYLRHEFDGQCVYCRKVDQGGNAEPFHIDHYRPKRFAEYICVYTNLFLACRVCNNHKHNYWPDEEHVAAKVFIPNPCNYVMFQHVQFDRAIVRAKTPAGEWMVERLRINADSSVEFRERSIRAFEFFPRAIKRLRAELADLEAQLEQNLEDEEERAILEGKIALAQADIDFAEDQLRVHGPPIVPEP